MKKVNLLGSILLTILASTANAYDYQVRCHFDESTSSGGVRSSTNTAVIRNVFYGQGQSAFFFHTSMTTSNPAVVLRAFVTLGYEVNDLTKGSFSISMKEITPGQQLYVTQNAVQGDSGTTAILPLAKLNGISLLRTEQVKKTNNPNGVSGDTCYPTCTNLPGSGQYPVGPSAPDEVLSTIAAQCQVTLINVN
jgi:hypothetical protein